MYELFKNLETAPEGSKHKRDGWINIHCPYCNSNNHLLGFNIYYKYFNCFACGKKPLYKTFNLLLGIPIPEIKELLKQSFNGEWVPKTPQYEKKKEKFKVPTYAKELDNLPLHKEYLKSRGINWKILKTYGVTGTESISSVDDLNLCWRLVIPVKHKGEIVTWQTRAIGERKPVYIDCPKEREIISIKELLYPEIYSHTLVLCEGVFDVWKVRQAGFPAVCVFGVGFKTEQLNLLKDKKLYIFFDGDLAGIEKAEKLKDRIEFITGNYVQIIPCPKGNDPGKLKIKTIRKIMKRYYT